MGATTCQRWRRRRRRAPRSAPAQGTVAKWSSPLLLLSTKAAYPFRPHSPLKGVPLSRTASGDRCPACRSRRAPRRVKSGRSPSRAGGRHLEAVKGRTGLGNARGREEATAVLPRTSKRTFEWSKWDRSKIWLPTKTTVIFESGQFFKLFMTPSAPYLHTPCILYNCMYQKEKSNFLRLFS